MGLKESHPEQWRLDALSSCHRLLASRNDLQMRDEACPSTGAMKANPGQRCTKPPTKVTLTSRHILIYQGSPWLSQPSGTQHCHASDCHARATTALLCYFGSDFICLYPGLL